MNIEPRYGDLRKSISSLVLHQIVSFSCEIVACQELFRVSLSAQRNQNDDGNEKKKKQQVNKHSENTERAAHYLADFFAVIARLTLSCQT